MIDISMCIEMLVPSANYRGCFEDNSKYEFDNLDWIDERDKPTWTQINNIALDIAKQEKIQWLFDRHVEILTEGYMTQLGFRVDCKSTDISNWDAALSIIDLIPDKITYSYNDLIASNYSIPDAYAIICNNFYPNTSIYTQIDPTWALTEFIIFITDNYKIEIGDYYNSNPPHLITIKQFKMMCIETGAYYQSMFSLKWTKRNLVLNATTFDELDDITW